MQNTNRTKNKVMSISNQQVFFKKIIESTPKLPGIYQMYNKDKEVLYIGKAKNIRSRLSDYTQFNAISYRIKQMLFHVDSVAFITTHNEAEALILEANLIKRFKPKYNILLKDDKSFPYILISDNHEYPGIVRTRDYKKNKGIYFGPFTSVKKVDDTISLLQKSFLIRSCSDSFFKNRKNPCMLYQLKRCSAPCVGKITQSDYKQLIDQTKDYFLNKDDKLKELFASKMNEASCNMDYEKAAAYRDRIKALSFIQSKQITQIGSKVDIDIIAVAKNDACTVVNFFFIRAGKNLGDRAYYLDATIGSNGGMNSNGDVDSQTYIDEGEILSSFIAKFYQNNMLPKEILVSHKVHDRDFLIESLSKIHNRNTNILIPQKGIKADLLDFAINNAHHKLESKVVANSRSERNLISLQKFLSLEEPIKKIEIYDNSHIQGTNAIGGMVAYDTNGFNKSLYRKFNITSTDNPDDYAMMMEVLTRRFARVKSLPSPEVIIIDGGIGHLNIAKKVLSNYKIDGICVVGIAKGVDRNSGNETILYGDEKPTLLDRNNELKKFLQILRDEAHRFAITSHRRKRSHHMIKSILDDIEGMGKIRKANLLKTFGSIDNIKAASLGELQKVASINKKIAKNIYNKIHSSSN